MTEGSSRLLKEYCTTGTQLRQNYLKHAPCLNQAQRTQRVCVKVCHLIILFDNVKDERLIK